MTRKTNARLAGMALLLYIIAGISNMALTSRIGGSGTAAHLAAIANHPRLIGVDILQELLEAACALIIAVTMYALTRDEDRDLAIVAMCCRVVEGAIAVIASAQALALSFLSTGNVNEPATLAIARLLIKSGNWTVLLAGSCFAVGSLIFSYLFLRSRTIPVVLAWIGVIASALLVVVLPLQLAGFLHGSMLVWVPMVFFEVPVALWLIVKGAEPRLKT